MFSFVPLFFFFNPPAPTEIYTLSLHDALPISPICFRAGVACRVAVCAACANKRSEEHTSELQSRFDLVCRLLLEKKKKRIFRTYAETIKHSMILSYAPIDLTDTR